MLEVVIDNRNGVLWNISELISSLSWKTSRRGKAGSMAVSFVNDPYQHNPDFNVQNGNLVRVVMDGVNIFLGYVFKIEESQDKEIKLTAYDQIRYLLGSDTYVFVNKTATEMIQRMATDLELKTGELANTVYVIPKQVEDGQQFLDIIGRALTETTYRSLETYVFYDDFGLLTLKNIKDLRVDLMIGEESLLYGYSRTRSIEDAANYVQIAQDNKKAGNRRVYPAEDVGSIARWGPLRLYRTVDEGLNEAQVKQVRDAVIAMRNQEDVKLKLDVLGDIRVRAGSGVGIVVEAIGISQMVIVEECTHNFDGDSYTMSLEVSGLIEQSG